MITEATIKRGVRDLARKCGVNHSTISRIVNGKRKPNKTLGKKLRRYGVKLPDTFGSIQPNN